MGFAAGRWVFGWWIPAFAGMTRMGRAQVEKPFALSQVEGRAYPKMGFDLAQPERETK